MVILRAMSSEPPKGPTASEPPPAAERSASKDLADGLQLMLSAAKKALRNVDPSKVEEVGRRALRNLETIDAKKVGELGRKAARNLDPRKIEEVAEDAGREILSVMERVAERVERIAGGVVQGAKEAARGSTPPPPQAATGQETPEKTEAQKAGNEPADKVEDKKAETSEAKPRVRVGE